MSTYENLQGVFGLFDQICSEAEKLGLGDLKEARDSVIPVYGHMYDRPLPEIVGFIFESFGLKDEFIEALKADDPQRAVIEVAEKAELTDEIDKDLVIPILCSVIVLVKNLESLSIFHLSINDLVQRIPSGDDESLFKAVYADPCALRSILVSQRISTAAFHEDGEFFEKLSKAIKRSRPTRPREHLDGVRLMLALVEDVEALSSVTDKSLTEWATNLDLYPVDGDALQAIRRQRQKRQKATSHQ